MATSESTSIQTSFSFPSKAVAFCHGRKARRRNPAIETRDAITILKQWHKKLGNSDEKIGTLVRAIYRNARYLPAEKHPEFGFWKRCFDAE